MEVSGVCRKMPAVVELTGAGHITAKVQRQSGVSVDKCRPSENFPMPGMLLHLTTIEAAVVSSYFAH